MKVALLVFEMALVSAVIGFLLVRSAFGQESLLKGDVNGDYGVTSVDALLELRVIARIDPHAMSTPWNADTDCTDPRVQDVLDMRDVLNILRFVAGLPTHQPDGCPPITGCSDYEMCAPIGYPWSATPAPEET